jgi:hypothetical protein
MAKAPGLPESKPHPAERITPDHVGLLVAALTMVLGGGWGIYVLVTQTIPRVGQRWFFFMLLQVTMTGLTIPIVRFLNVRFTPIDRQIPPSSVILRQATWVSLFVVTCAWLQIPRVLTWSIAFFLAIIFVIVEFFLRLRERQFERVPE